MTVLIGNRKWICGVLVLVLLASSAAVFAKTPDLPPHYKEWLTRDVAYIITREERDAFLSLTSDQARDAFIQHFWEIRNPTPGSPINEYKEEHYKRLDYASRHFGHNGQGWRTDMGRIYITLGKPKQQGVYRGLANVRPMEIWFYEGNSPALPPYFYVVFYQRDAGDDYRLYSPYMDGPDKLANTLSAVNDRVAGFKIIDQAAGREVARTTLSLLPDEPVDIDRATSSLESDVLLNTIKTLADNPINKQILNERRQLLESVTHRVILTGEYLDVLTVPLVDRQGNTNLHYLMRLKRPDDFTLTKTGEERYFYSVETSVRVLTAQGKEVFVQNRKLSEYLNPQQVENIKRKVFGFEGVLPLPAGKYKIDFLYSNAQSHTSLRVEKDVEIPQPGAQPLWITPLVAFSEAKPVRGAEEASTPFLGAGVKFVPVPKEPIELIVGQPLQFFYQVWARPGAAAASAAADSKLNVQIAYGRMGLRDTKTISDDLPRNQFDANGTIINGKVIPTVDLPPGNYRVTLTVSDPQTQARAFSSFHVRLSPSAYAPGAWDVVDPELGTEAQRGVLEYDRALAYLAEGKQAEALPWLQRSFEKNPQSEQVRARLVDGLLSSQAFAKVADVYRKAGVTEQTDERTVLGMAESLEKVGELQSSLHLLQSAVALRPSSGPLYMALAGAYHRLGDTQKATEAEQKAKSLIAAKPQT